MKKLTLLLMAALLGACSNLQPSTHASLDG
jgi:uncharacterized lipoprotein YmbA